MLIDVFAADPEHGPASREALRDCMEAGGLQACEVVWAEVASGFAESTRASELLDSLGVAFRCSIGLRRSPPLMPSAPIAAPGAVATGSSRTFWSAPMRPGAPTAC